MRYFPACKLCKNIYSVFFYEYGAEDIKYLYTKCKCKSKQSAIITKKHFFGHKENMLIKLGLTFYTFEEYCYDKKL
jgi:hypothetical protein